VVVTLGAAGAMAVGDAAEHVPGFGVEAVDATGAGDVFIGALAVFLAEGTPMLPAVRQANAAAAVSVTRPGTQAAAPARAEVDALLRSADLPPV
jgi:ribokinase